MSHPQPCHCHATVHRHDAAEVSQWVDSERNLYVLKVCECRQAAWDGGCEKVVIEVKGPATRASHTQDNDSVEPEGVTDSTCRTRGESGTYRRLESEHRVSGTVPATLLLLRSNSLPHEPSPQALVGLPQCMIIQVHGDSDSESTASGWAVEGSLSVDSARWLTCHEHKA
jgi:hypothetical protein